MKKSDISWCLLYVLLAVASAVLVISGGFAWFNRTLPYLAGAVQFAVYATAGELLSTRMLEGRWEVNRVPCLWRQLGIQRFAGNSGISSVQHWCTAGYGTGIPPLLRKHHCVSFLYQCPEQPVFWAHPLRTDSCMCQLCRFAVYSGREPYGAAGS